MPATCSAPSRPVTSPGVGFDLYLRMIGEAVSTFRGDVAEGQTELRLELPVDAHIPEDYVDSERLRLEAYQKLSAASGARREGRRRSTRARRAHRPLRRAARGGEAPHRGLAAAPPAQRAGLADVVAMGSNLRIAPANLPDSMRVRLQRLYPGAKHFAQNDVILVPFPGSTASCPSDADLIDWVSRLVIAIFPLPEPATAEVPAAASGD